MPKRLAPPPPGPTGDFASYLRDLSRQAGEPDRRRMHRATGYGRSALHEAFAGKKLPTWQLAERLVGFLRGDVEDARRRWASAKKAQTQPGSEADSYAESAPIHQAHAAQGATPAPKLRNLAPQPHPRDHQPPEAAEGNQQQPGGDISVIKAGNDDTASLPELTQSHLQDENLRPLATAGTAVWIGQLVSRRRRWVPWAAVCGVILIGVAGVLLLDRTVGGRHSPLSHEIACRPRMPSEPEARGEVRNLIEATYQLCVAHPDTYFFQQQTATVTSFRPSGQSTVTYLVHVNSDGYVELRITGPSDQNGTWSASWQQNPTRDCWNELIVTGPNGYQITHTIDTDCHRTS